VSGITQGLDTAKSHFHYPTLLTRDEARRIDIAELAGAAAKWTSRRAM